MAVMWWMPADLPGLLPLPAIEVLLRQPELGVWRASRNSGDMLGVHGTY
jgi:hypothetical protein